MRNLIHHLFLVFALLCLFASQSNAKRKALEIGDASPKWGELEATDNKNYTLESFKNSKLVVVIFSSNNCPVAQMYETRLSKLVEDYAEKGVALVAINSNADEDLKAMKSHAKKKKLKYVYVKDATQKVAKSFGARMTPEVFVLDQKRKVAYLGGIDDDRMTGKPKEHYLREAIELLLAGKEPKNTKTKAFGCTIKWKP